MQLQKFMLNPVNPIHIWQAVVTSAAYERDV